MLGVSSKHLVILFSVASMRLDVDHFVNKSSKYVSCRQHTRAQYRVRKNEKEDRHTPVKVLD